MAGEICDCGHLKSDHIEYKWIKPSKEAERTYLERLAKGQGMCSKYGCSQFKKRQSE